METKKTTKPAAKKVAPLKKKAAQIMPVYFFAFSHSKGFDNIEFVLNDVKEITLTSQLKEIEKLIEKQKFSNVKIINFVKIREVQ